MTASRAGELPPPPIQSIIGGELLAFNAGEATVSYEPREYHLNGAGSVHGGVAAALLDTATGLAVTSRMPPGARRATLELSVRFIRVVALGLGPLHCEGSLLHLGRRTAVARGDLLDNSGQIYAHGVATYLITLPNAGA